MLEIVFPRFQISKFSGGHDPLEKSREQPNLQQSDFGLDPPLHILYMHMRSEKYKSEHKVHELLKFQLLIPL